MQVRRTIGFVLCGVDTARRFCDDSVRCSVYIPQFDLGLWVGVCGGGEESLGKGRIEEEGERGEGELFTVNYHTVRALPEESVALGDFCS